jgi:ribosomal protein S27AE
MFGAGKNKTGGKKNAGSHGGTRAHSGAKTNAQRLGRPKKKGTIVSHFTASTTTTTTTTTEEQPNPSIPLREAALENNNKPASWHAEVQAQYSGISRQYQKGSRYKHTGILKEQMEKINSKEYNAEAIKSVKKGDLWDRPKAVLHQHCTDLKTSWKSFFCRPVFNWFPTEMLPAWKPKCGTCGMSDSMRKNGQNNPCRSVYAEHENFIINAPQRWACGKCAKTAQAQKNASVSRKERVQYTWLSTDDVILDQIATEDPEIFEHFPCFLTQRAGIEKDFFFSILLDAAKGTGPGTASESMERKHHKKWQSKEIQWAGHLRRRLQDPLIGDDKNIGAEDIEKCPDYCSEKISGITPGASWLIFVFCRIVGSWRRYLDAECLKRLKTSEQIALDASYKLPKWIARWGGTKMFDCLETGLNEYGETVLQHFETSDNHRQLRPVLEYLQTCGLDPRIAFSDVPARDRGLLESIFHSLKVNVATGPGYIPDGSLPILPLHGETIYANSKENILSALRLLTDCLDQEEDMEKKVISVDFEWPVFDGGNRKGRISTVQIVSELHVNGFLIHLNALEPRGAYTEQAKSEWRAVKEVLEALARLFNREDVAFAGRHIQNDFTKLNSDYAGILGKSFDPKNVIDVGLMAINRGLVQRKRGQTGLGNLSEILLKKRLPNKSSHGIRVSDVWDERSRLCVEAQEYAMRDAAAGLLLYHFVKDLPDLTKRIKPDEMRCGMHVDIMPSAAKATQPIAQGIIHKVEGSNAAFGVTLSKCRCVVKITHVFDKTAVAHFPVPAKGRGCLCGRNEHGAIRDVCNFTNLECFGEPPFQMVESCSRLRRKDVMDDDSNDLDDDNDDNGCGFTTAPAVDGDEDGDDGDNEETEIDATDEPPVDGDDGESVASDDNDITKADLGLEQDHVDQLNALFDLLDDSAEDNDNLECPNLGENLGDRADNNESEEPMTPVQEAILDEIEEVIAKLIAEADATTTTATTEAESVRSPSTWVLGDAFHVMDAVKVPMHHDFKAAYFRALRAAMFLMDAGDVGRVKRVLESKGKSWSRSLAFNFRYLALRIRRRIPPPDVLYKRVKAIFDFFADKVDSTTGMPLFKEKAKERAERVLKMIAEGYISDPPGYEFYVRKTDSRGRPMVDKDGLRLYRSLRGTSTLESLHQKLTLCFGHFRAGIEYSDCLLAIVRHIQNWRASERNRPDFPQVRHYDGRALDMMNELYEAIFGYPKYSDWIPFNEAVGTSKASPFGIVPLGLKIQAMDDIDIKSIQILPRSLRYLAVCQGSPVPYTPVRGLSEVKVFKVLLLRILADGRSMTASETFQYMAELWNSEFAKGSNKVYKKYPEHLSMYYKKWAKNQARDTAVKEANVERLLAGVEYIPAAHAIAAPRSLVGLNGLNVRNGVTEVAAESRENRRGMEENELELDSGEDGDGSGATDGGVTNTDQNGINNGTVQLWPIVTPTPTMHLAPRRLAQMPTTFSQSFAGRKRSRTCGVDGCKDPSNCPGSSNRMNCRSLGDTKGRKKQGQRTCQECIEKGQSIDAARRCPGIWRRKNCRSR